LLGELITQGVPGTTMAAFALEAAEVADLAEFLHSFQVSGRDPARERPGSIVIGNAAAGKQFFAGRCAGCHAAEGDLRGVATRFADPRALQQQWLMPRRAPPVVVVVTMPDGAAVAGTLARIDEFIVSLSLPDGTSRTYARDGNTPRVELRDPLAAHKALLPVYTDKDIHDMTAYLATLE
jgi:hypothetical protein